MHTYLIGASGSGKSTFMQSEADGAFAFIDKHGQGARQLADTG
jgi:ABC-type lipoprotein export system ATPase subunit